ncbi:MAG: SDR family oxidoreductase [Propionibacteriaceae bacterium]|nr:SDR family oxidoreductase [Propionibacteriaceae bacterium]
MTSTPSSDESLRIAETIQVVAPVLRGLLGSETSLAIVTCDSSDQVRDATSKTSVAPQVIGMNPVCVVEPAYAPLADQVRQAVEHYRHEVGQSPQVVVLPGKVVFGAGDDYASARANLDLFLEALGAGVGDQAPSPGDQPPTQQPRSSRLSSKVVVLAGAAQGFGLGLAQGLAEEGAHIVLADMNIARARSEASLLVNQYGRGAALAVELNVAIEESQRLAWQEILATYGGVDVFISNAGITRTGSVTEQRREDFELVTAVNYTGYFLSVRSIVPIMAAQHEVRPELLFDIIDINSTSGLEGTRSNFSYLGSQAGAIGLSRSFAMDLIGQGIKINTVCPGNYLDGPLWSDPESGFFAQYLRAGRVPGASTIGDVRAFFEAKVPMGRGCLPSDVVRAVLYLVEQQYETGQSLPVTGGRITMN